MPGIKMKRTAMSVSLGIWIRGHDHKRQKESRLEVSGTTQIYMFLKTTSKHKFPI